MADETTTADNSSINATINAVAGLAQAIPVYQDALQPAAKEVGKSLEVVAKVVSIALAPLKGIIWGYEKIENFITESVGKKLENVSNEDIITPAANIVGPAIEALKFAGEDINLRELYANLIANAMDKKTQSNAHPAFVDIIKSLTGSEALILKYFSELEITTIPVVEARFQLKESNIYKIAASNMTLIGKNSGLPEEEHQLVPSYLINLCRLGLLQMKEAHLPNSEGYIEIQATFESVRIELEKMHPDRKIVYMGSTIEPTDFGDMFIKSVIKDKN